jgi:hypothetical protein
VYYDSAVSADQWEIGSKGQCTGKRRAIVISKGYFSCLCILSSALSACAEPKQPLTWQQRRLEYPTKPELQWESKNRVMIYEGMKDREVEHAFDNHFDRIESMMFVNTVVTDENGEPLKDPETGRVMTEPDGCE